MDIQERIWSGKEDSNLRPLRPEHNAYRRKAQKSVVSEIFATEQARNKGRFSPGFTGATPERLKVVAEARAA